MKQLFKITFFITILVIGASAKAQEQRLFVVVNYNPSVPLGALRDYVSKTSFRGFQGAILYHLNENVRIGLQVTYNDFYQKYGRQVYKATDGTDISTVLSNTMQLTPVLIKGEYAFLKTGWIKPYAGLGAGISLVNFRQYYGEFPYEHSYAKPSFSGDIGLLIPFNKTSEYGFRLSTSYNFSPFNEEGIKNIQTWNVQAGVVIPLK